MLSAMVCAFCAEFGLAVSASAETETIAYWPFGTNGFHDVSGNGHDFVGVEIAESDAGYVSLNQGTTTNQFLKTAAALDLSGETAVTFECWCRITGRPAGVYGVLFSTPEPWVGTGGLILYNVGIYQAQMRTSTAGWHLDSTYTKAASPSAYQALGDDYVDGAWHHVAYVIDRSKGESQDACRLYLDGVIQKNNGNSGSAPYTVPSLFNDFFQIGNCLGYVVGKSYFRGYIDDVRISRGVVAPKDFLKYPSVGKTMRADDGKLPVVAYWPFGGKYNRDATGNGFDLTMDSTIPLASGTPKVAWSERAVFTNFYLTSFPMSAFSKTGVTIECFVKSDSGSTGAGNILMLSPTVQYHNNVGAFRFSYEANFKTAGMVLRLSPATKCAQSITTEEQFGALNDNRWRHFAAVYDPSKKGAGIVTFYVDGVAAPCSSDDADQGAVAMPDTKLYFSRIAKDTGAFYGQFDDVRITAGVLTPDKFMASRSVGSTVALYRFDRETLEDQSGNGNDLIHMHTESMVADPVFGDAGYPASGTGLVLTGTEDKSGNVGTRDWVKTSSPIDFSETKAFTIEFDYNSKDPTEETVIPSGKTDKPVYVMAAATQVGTRGGFVTYRSGNSLQGQFRNSSGSGWLFANGKTLGTETDGYKRGRFSVNGRNAGHVYYHLVVDGVDTSMHNATDYGSFGSHVLGFGHCPSYYADATTPYYMKGKLLRIAVSDIALDAADYVLDNLVLDTPKATLAYWNFSGFDDKSGAGNDLVASSGCKIRRGALALDGASSAVTDDTLYLSGLTQATIECFVCFDKTPSSGTLFSLGSGVGSFAVTADATAGTLTGSFIPYDHLAASNGGVADLAALAVGTGVKLSDAAAWHHVALVIDRTKSGADAVRFYVDYQRAMPAGRAWDAAATMLDGTLTVGTGFTGYIDDLRVSKGALEPSEFLQVADHTYVPDGICIIIR